jgi:Novel STAND NTPase 1
VVGPRGPGKSSVVMAGLLPRLREGRLPGSEQWVYLDPIVPGRRPIEVLTLALFEHLPDKSLKAIREDLEDDTARGLHLLATKLAKRPRTKVVLLVDQFEELFTQTPFEGERRHFLDLLVTAITEPHGPFIVLLTLRADFYDRPIRYPELGQLIDRHHQLIFPMKLDELRATIEQPAALPDVQVTFEGDLVGDLLFEVQGQVGALPLLQFTLDQLFQRRSGRQLTLSAYRELGGVKGALTRQAEETYAALPSDEHRKLARALFVRLIDPGASEQDTTRRRAALSEFSLADASQTRLLQEVTDAFIAVRLLTTNEIAGTTTIEVSHEALIREWPRLAGWLREARDDIPLQQAISEDASEWEQHNKPGERVYRGSQLKEAQAWARRNTPSGNEMAFLRAGTAHRLRSVASVTLIVLLLLSTTGIAGWFLSRPDPTHVTTLLDDGPGSLRQAIAAGSTIRPITFDTSLSGTIMLMSQLNITTNLTIQGPVARALSVSSGTSGHRVHVLKGFSVTISNLIFKDSTISLNSFIYNEGTLSLSNSIISGNRAVFSGGGGIYNEGTLSLINSTVSDNKADFLGSSDGGSIYNVGTLTIINSTVSGNTVSRGNGGGIYNRFEDRFTIINSTISDNSASSAGGIYNEGTLSLSNSTVSGNSASGQNGVGGIETASFACQTCSPAQADLNFSTIYGNRGPGGADIAIKDKFSTQRSQVKISNSIVAGDPAHRGPDILGMLTSDGYNLFQDNSGATFDPATGTQHIMDKTLSTNDLTKLFASPVGLRDNKGTTKTFALAPDSPAVDQVPLRYCQVKDIFNDQSRMYTDQRGMKRPDGNEDACDIGAFEYTDQQA